MTETRTGTVKATGPTVARKIEAAIGEPVEWLDADLGKKDITVVADRGYYSGTEILACEELGARPLVPKPLTSGNRAQGLFDKRDFIYYAARNEYRCPAGQTAP